ncbi:MAG: hypothetical protein MUF25_04550 [Pirellulaceae bacterium]|nr:hypothetical protein [Pirellulaceae bacterium]
MTTHVSWRRLGRGCLLAAVAGLAFWLRIGQATESLWLDELHTSWVVADGAQQLVPRATIGNYTPAYFGLVWAVTKCAGASEVCLRLPSVLAGTALVAGVCLVVVHWTASWSAGLLAALLVALDRHCVFYAQEARPYALVQLLGLLHVVVFGCLVYRPHLALRATWIGTGVMLFYLHYTAALLFVAEVAFYGVVRLGGRYPRAGDSGGPPLAGASGLCHPLAGASGFRPPLAGASGLGAPPRPRAGTLGYRWRQLVTDVAWLGIGLLPAVPHVREIAQRRQDWSSFVPARSWWRIWELADVFPLDVYVLAPLAILALAWIGARLSRRQPAAAFCGTCELRWFLLVLCWFLVPLGIAWAVTAQGYAPLFFRRYLMAAAVAPILGTALCCAACPSALWRGGLAITVVGLSIYEGGLVSQWRQDGRVIGDRNQDWRSAVAYVRERARADAPVFVRSGLIEAERWCDSPQALRREYCLLPVLGLYRLDQPREILFPLPIRPPAVLSADARRHVLACGQAWCLVQGSESSVARFEEALRSRWQRAGLPVASVQRFSFRHVAALHVTVAAPSPLPSRRAPLAAEPR